MSFTYKRKANLATVDGLIQETEIEVEFNSNDETFRCINEPAHVIAHYSGEIEIAASVIDLIQAIEERSENYSIHRLHGNPEEKIVACIEASDDRLKFSWHSVHLMGDPPYLRAFLRQDGTEPLTIRARNVEAAIMRGEAIELPDIPEVREQVKKIEDSIYTASSLLRRVLDSEEPTADFLAIRFADQPQAPAAPASPVEPEQQSLPLDDDEL